MLLLYHLDELTLFTAEGFWYSNKRFPRVQHPLVRDWTTE